MGLFGAIKKEMLLPKVKNLERQFRYAFVYYCDKLELSSINPSDLSAYELERILDEFQYSQKGWGEENREIWRKCQEVQELFNIVTKHNGGSDIHHTSTECYRAYWFTPFASHADIPKSRMTEVDSYILRLKNYIASF